MTSESSARDLVVLAADGQMEFAVRGLLTRRTSLQLPELALDIFVHPQKDPGCLLRGHEFLRPFYRQYEHALVMFDCEGCGRQGVAREVLEAEVEQRLAASGWGDRAAAVAIDPELEIWVWSDSPEVDAALGWAGRQPPLAAWLVEQGFCGRQHTKPDQPKRALEEALRIARKRRSSAIFRQLAERVSIHRCVDAAFLKLTATLQRWFGTIGNV